MAILDTAMDVDGHILVIPKAHVTSILDCDETLLNRVFLTVKKVSNHLVNDCGYQGVDLMSASGEAAGQSLPHFPVHLIPRREQDGLGARGERPLFPGAAEDVAEVYEKLRFR
ncbi:MAG: HIT domain-containing protein [Eubacteriales bacterium]|nr:HIT domain-containing protein [Eubacteriales bacterium]